MFSRTRLILIVCSLLKVAVAQALPPEQVSDSLKTVLARTSDPHTRISLLVNLKDLNEDSELEVPYSTQLFREAAALGDTYAMSTAVIPILDRYATYTEKEDSLQFYIHTLHTQTPGTPQEGIADFAELDIAYQRFSSETDLKKRIKTAREITAWYKQSEITQGNIYQRTKGLILTGLAAAHIPSEGQRKNPSAIRLPRWDEAYKLIVTMPNPAIRKLYAELLYNLLATGYYYAKDYSRLTALTDLYIRQLDQYFAYERKIDRRPYFYGEDQYQIPYWQLIRSAAATGETERAKEHFNNFRQRMLTASPRNRIRNLSSLYELGYLWKFYTKDFAQSLLYCDSLTDLIERRQGYLRMQPISIAQTYRNRSGILKRLGRYEEAFHAYARAFEVQDSLFATEREKRIEALKHRNEMDRLQLAQTRTTIRSHITAIVSAIIIGMLLIATGTYYYRALRRNRHLQNDIFRHTRKALESERMKSNFVNSICGCIRPPFNAIDQAAYRLMIMDLPEQERTVCLEAIRTNTRLLLSTLDNMLEAATLDSMTDQLQLSPTDISMLCNAELCRARQLKLDSQVEYILDGPQTSCIAHTHARYFTFVVRALLDNAGKFTPEGHIILQFQTDTARNELRITVSDTGRGIPSELHEEIFSSESNNPSVARGSSLALCRLIATHLKGSIRLDETYSQGAKFIFILPLRP